MRSKDYYLLYLVLILYLLDLYLFYQDKRQTVSNSIIVYVFINYTQKRGILFVQSFNDFIVTYKLQQKICLN